MENKNLLVIFADQWRNKSMGIHNTDIETPNFDQFYKDSVAFENAASTCPLCSPYRAVLFSGKYPVANGVYGNCMTGYNIALKEEEVCISDILNKEGYETGYIGKWHLDEPEQNFTTTPISGAKDWDAYTPEGPKRHGFKYWHAYNAWNQHMNQHYWENSPEKIKAKTWSPIHETDKAIEYIEAVKENNFALFLSWNPPHTPFEQVPEKYLELYKDKKITLEKNVTTNTYVNHTKEQGFDGRDLLIEKTKQYYASITGLDEQFGRIISYLKENNLYDNTLIIVTSDHGEHLGSHGYVGKHTWYEESINVPMMIRYPQKLIPHNNKSCIDTHNLMPTILSLLDIKKKYMSDSDISQSLIRKEIKEKDYSFISCYISRDIFIEAYKQIGINPVDVGWRAIRTNRYTYVIFRGYEPRENTRVYLYDRLEDPEQLHPIESSDIIQTATAKKLHKCLMEHLRTENSGFYNWCKLHLTC